jgi:F-type H+-transporting ATPase subunit epsilon
MFKLTLVTPEKKVVTGQDLQEITVPGHHGELNIHVGHAPLITTLIPGVLKYKLSNGAEKAAAISWGYCQVSPEGVNILAETIESPEEIDVDRAENALKSTEERVVSETLEDELWEELQGKMDRAKARIEAAKLR